ncbi:MAG TPA: cytochrome C [Burkholderiales bacterium]|jgi:cytochrome c|nr:cytochrome C [Burkholderiales bacterium]
MRYKSVRCAGVAATLVCSVTLGTPSFSAEDLAAGRDLAISHCSQCHTFGKGEPHGQGPSLFGLIGREAAAIPGYRFSEGYVAAMKGKVWDAALLDLWLADTLALAPGTQMIYWQDDPEKRHAMIRYLESLR